METTKASSNGFSIINLFWKLLEKPNSFHGRRIWFHYIRAESGLPLTRYSSPFFVGSMWDSSRYVRIEAFWSQYRELMDRRIFSGLLNCEKRKEKTEVSSSTPPNA
jgi:hypothetical protein